MTVGRLSVNRYLTQCAHGGPHVVWTQHVVAFCTGRTTFSWRR